MPLLQEDSLINKAIFSSSETTFIDERLALSRYSVLSECYYFQGRYLTGRAICLENDLDPDRFLLLMAVLSSRLGYDAFDSDITGFIEDHLFIQSAVPWPQYSCLFFTLNDLSYRESIHLLVRDPQEKARSNFFFRVEGYRGYFYESRQWFWERKLHEPNAKYYFYYGERLWTSEIARRAQVRLESLITLIKAHKAKPETDITHLAARTYIFRNNVLTIAQLSRLTGLPKKRITIRLNQVGFAYGDDITQPVNELVIEARNKLFNKMRPKNENT